MALSQRQQSLNHRTVTIATDCHDTATPLDPLMDTH
jgi:hypothetical protein